MQITRIYNSQISEGFLDADYSNVSEVLVDPHSPRSLLFFGGRKMELIKELPREFSLKEKYHVRQGLFWCSHCQSEIKKPLKLGLKYKGCGCLRGKNIIHGESDTKLYSIWKAMKKRCNNKNSSDYKYYGGRGIEVCPDWQNDFKSFKKWAVENGFKENLKLDRIKNNEGYSPDNCQFITHAKNCRKRSNSILNSKLVEKIRLKYRTGVYTQQELANEYNVSRSHISNITRKNGIWRAI